MDYEASQMIGERSSSLYRMSCCTDLLLLGILMTQPSQTFPVLDSFKSLIQRQQMGPASP